MMTIPASFWTEDLSQRPKPIGVEGESDGDGGRERHRRDQSQ